MRSIYRTLSLNSSLIPSYSAFIGLFILFFTIFDNYDYISFSIPVLANTSTPAIAGPVFYNTYILFNDPKSPGSTRYNPTNVSLLVNIMTKIMIIITIMIISDILCMSFIYITMKIPYDFISVIYSCYLFMKKHLIQTLIQ